MRKGQRATRAVRPDSGTATRRPPQIAYVEHFINTGHTKWITVLLVLAGLWIPAVINLTGVKNMT